MAGTSPAMTIGRTTGHDGYGNIGDDGYRVTSGPVRRRIVLH